MRIEITESSFDPWRILSEYCPSDEPRSGATVACAGEFGATAVFVGTMRDFNQGDTVRSMRLEYYPEMVHVQLERLIERAASRYKIKDVLLIHRVGDILPGEAIVLVAIWSAHRSDAYGANRYIMEELKSRVPLWKRESLNDTVRWVEKNTPGD